MESSPHPLNRDLFLWGFENRGLVERKYTFHEKPKALIDLKECIAWTLEVSTTSERPTSVTVEIFFQKARMEGNMFRREGAF